MAVVPLDGPAARRQVLGRRDGHGHVRGQGEDRLDEAFSPGVVADDEPPVVVHDRAADDLRGAGRPLVDEDDEGQLLELLVPEGPEILVVAPVPAADGDDQGALGQEFVRDLDRRDQAGRPCFPRRSRMRLFIPKPVSLASFSWSSRSVSSAKVRMKI